jgi:hypothetical protein
VAVFGAKASDGHERRHPQHGRRDTCGVQHARDCSPHDPSRLLYCFVDGRLALIDECRSLTTI